jgi:hypothetical protein
VAERDDDLLRDLAALGRAAEAPAPSPALATAVLARVSALPDRAGRGGRWQSLAAGLESRRRRVALVVGAVLLALLATPPVRAEVVDWFGFGAVRVEREDGPSTEPAPPPPEVSSDASVAEAAAAVGFVVSVPVELGDPDAVEVSLDEQRVSMSWRTDEAGVVRLDQFGARLDYSVLKTAPEVSWVAVHDGDALWFEEPHEVALLQADGSSVRHPPRLAGHTLIWQDGSVTLRLEGDVDLVRAVEIAESAVPVG